MSPHYALRCHLARLSRRISSYNSFSLFTCGTIVFGKLWCKLPTCLSTCFGLWTECHVPNVNIWELYQARTSPFQFPPVTSKSKHFLLFTALYHNELYFATSYLFFILHNQLRVFLPGEYIHHHPSDTSLHWLSLNSLSCSQWITKDTFLSPLSGSILNSFKQLLPTIHPFFLCACAVLRL